MKKLFWIIFALLLISIGVNVWMMSRKPDVDVVIKHDTVWRDSIIRKPVGAETIRTERVVKLSVAQSQTQHDSAKDSIDVPIPIMQKRYEDSMYTAWVSGFEPSLDSIRLHLPEVQTTVTKTIVKKSPLFTVGIQAGGGYGIFNKKPDVYVGLGVQFNLLRK